MTDVKRIGPEDAYAKMAEGYTYVDVRTESEFADGHPEGAFNVPIMLQSPNGMVPNPEFMQVMNAHFPKAAKIIVGCRTGVRSMRAAQELLANGYTEVLEQRAGWDGARDPFGQVSEPGWVRIGLPIEAGAPRGRAYVELVRK